MTPARRVFISGFLGLFCAVQAAGAKPNVILILADDLGAKELGCYGNTKHHTPNLDALAASGTRFETFYVNPLCTPTRMALMTGQYGFHNGFLGMANPAFVPSANSPQRDIAHHFTHAALMRSAGYATAVVGKWQLSGKLPDLVYEAGFDEYRIWAYDKNLPENVSHPAHDHAGRTSRYWHPCILENGKYLSTQPTDYGPDLFNDSVIDFVRRHKTEPFFVYYSSVLTHSPHVETPDPQKTGSRKSANFQSNLEYLDHLMGKLLAALQSEGLDKNTLIFFIGDNGTEGSGKGTLTEKGARTPCILRGPGVPVGRVSRALSDVTDVFPTLADWAGIPLPADRPCDGKSLLPVLRDGKETHREWIYSHLDDGRVLRDARWLLEIDKGGKGEKFFDCGSSRDGTGYRDVTASPDPEAKEARMRFARILATLPEPIPHAKPAPGTDTHSAAKTKNFPKSAAVAAPPAASPSAEKSTRFKKRDLNGDGKIDMEEFVKTRTGGDKPAALARFRAMDANRDGILSREEFSHSGNKSPGSPE